MRILLVHNFYQQPGGEDRVFVEEGKLLEARGHHVRRYTAHNREVQQLNKLALAKATIWNSGTYQALRALLREERPDVVHFHNTLPLISPAAYHAAAREGAAVVQTLHNYRLLCPGALFFREGRVCEDCLGRRLAWPAVAHGCYRGSSAATGAIAAMTAAHHGLGTWTKQIQVYIAITEFVRQKFIAGGLPPEKLIYKPHFVHPDPSPGQGEGGYALFVGRLTKEKGLQTLLSAWNMLPSEAALKIVGDGPLAPSIAGIAEARPNITWLGRKSPDEVATLMAAASVVIVPSEWYETFGRVIIEAFSVGTPVIVANIGAIAELVAHGRTGRLFRAGDPRDLADQAAWMLSHTAERNRMRQEARDEYEAKYTADRNYEMLIDIYETAIRAARVSPATA